MAFINLQPHPVKIGTTLIPPSGMIARVAESLVQTGEIDGVPVLEQKLGDVSIQHNGNESAAFDSEVKEGVYYIVSLMVAMALPGRRDLLIPVGQTRDEQGRINGSTGLAINPY